MKRAEPGWLLLTLAGLAALLGSFLPFYTFARGVDATVWSRGLFPTAALIPLLGFLIGAEALFVLITGREPRSPFLNFTWEQVRLAVGAFMILLALSYLLQDRAGGTLGVGYLILSLSSLATFAGGVMTRRAQLARAPGEEPPVREPQPLVKPAMATVSRFGNKLSKNVTDMSGSVKDRLAARKEAREAKAKAKAEARADAAAKAEAVAKTAAAKAVVDAKAAAAKAEVEAKAAEAQAEADAKAAAAAKSEADAKAAAEPAKAEAAVTEALPVQPPPPTQTFDVPPSELPAAAEQGGVPPPPIATPDGPDDTPAEEPAAEEAATPTEELEADDAHAPTKELVGEDAETTEELVVDDPDKTAPPDGAGADKAVEAKDQSAAQKKEENEEEKEEEGSPRR
jgi:hypothetical protein